MHAVHVVHVVHVVHPAHPTRRMLNIDFNPHSRIVPSQPMVNPRLLDLAAHTGLLA
jgi:hypothetical protein